MRLLDLRAKATRKHKTTTDSNYNKHVSVNLLKQKFTALSTNYRWGTDITYIPTQEGWLYLCVIIDLFSRAVIGWAIDTRMKADLVCSALNEMFFKRNFPSGVIIHSDKESQYCSKQYQDIIKDNRLLSSMNSKGSFYDNAACESFFGTLKVELVHDENHKTREEAKSSISEYIETYYNTKENI